ncbi:MAG TPA: hypothetical protein VF416_04505 [Marmoricola sp.]
MTVAPLSFVIESELLPGVGICWVKVGKHDVEVLRGVVAQGPPV